MSVPEPHGLETFGKKKEKKNWEGFHHFFGLEFSYNFGLMGRFCETQLSALANPYYLLCIVELEGGGSLAVGIVDR